jgi:hypothetical protein
MDWEGFEVSGNGLIEILSRNFPAGSEENYENKSG